MGEIHADVTLENAGDREYFRRGDRAEADPPPLDRPPPQARQQGVAGTGRRGVAALAHEAPRAACVAGRRFLVVHPGTATTPPARKTG